MTIQTRINSIPSLHKVLLPRVSKKADYRNYPNHVRNWFYAMMTNDGQSGICAGIGFFFQSPRAETTIAEVPFSVFWVIRQVNCPDLLSSCVAPFISMATLRVVKGNVQIQKI